MSDDVALVRGLVEIPSLSGQEGEAVEWLVERMRERGFRAHVDDSGSAVGEVGAGPRQVVLLGHIDTVPGEIPVRLEGGELVGRGAVDAKGPLAAFVAAASRPVPGVRVTVVGAVEEESPTSAGARHRATHEAPHWCVVGEPSGWDGITVGYKGRLLLEVELERAGRHGAAPGATVSEEALEVWARLRVAASEIATGRAFDRLDCRLEGMWSGAADGLAERASLRVGYRLPPGQSADGVEERARQAAALHQGDATVSIRRVASEEPVRSARTSSLARAFVAAINTVGGRPAFKVKSGTSDMNVLAAAWSCPMVAYGPGDSAYDHTPMERLSLEDYSRSIDVISEVIRRAALDGR